MHRFSHPALLLVPSLLVSAFAACPARALEPAPGPTPLKAGRPVEKELMGGQTHAFQVRLKAGETLYATVDQRGIDVEVHVIGPAGRTLATIDSPNGTQGVEPVTVTARRDGQHRIEVVPLEPGAKPGRYEIRLLKVLRRGASPAERLDQTLALLAQPNTPGVAIAVLQDGKIVYRRGVGSANLEYGIPITPTTVFHVASVSKQFTAFAIGLLAEQGKLSLDDDIRKYLPEMHDFGAPITIRHLLYHTSGLRDQWEALAVAGWRMDDVITQDHILRLAFRETELNFPTGEQFLYCNTGYTLLAEIVRRVSGKPFAEFTREAIFDPLEMRNTHFHIDHHRVVPNRAYSYEPAPGGGFQNSPLNFANAGATSLFTTVEDLARWLDNFATHRVGGPTLWKQMDTPGALNGAKPLGYGMALAFETYRGLKAVGHNGSDAGYRSAVLRFPEQRFAVAVLSNVATFDPDRLTHQAADLYLEKAFPPPASAEPAKPAPAAPEVSVAPTTLAEYSGAYQLRPGWVLNLSVIDGRLTVQATGEQRFPTQAESETRFFVPAYGAPLEFQRGDDGKVARLVYRGMQAPRVEAFTPSAQELEQYTGTYYSPELDTTYTLRVRDGKLIAEHPRNETATLTPTIADQFQGNRWYFSNLVFIRDAEGKVTGLRLSGSRVRNLRFDRKP